MPSLSPQHLYTPFDSGHYAFSVGLDVLAPDAGVFEFDDQLSRYRENKDRIRAECEPRHVGAVDFPATLRVSVTHWLQERLSVEHPDSFSQHSLDTFEDIAYQVQDDLAVVHVPTKGEDRLVAVHVCAPSGWDPSKKLGKSFLGIHAPIPEMEPINRNAANMMRALTREGIRQRFVWGIQFDNQLNRHPDVITPENRIGFDADSPEVFVRVERQCIIGFPEESGFLFTIRPYIYDVATLSSEHRRNLRDALRSLSPAILRYKGIEDDVKPVIAWLESGL